jgi:EAL domain-containing protein (putative c-di-GMP-specific phosphodiesterase class I)
MRSATLSRSPNARHLQALGCRVAIDDFGTGYASYARLKTMNVDILKIDGSFIRNLLASSLITRWWILFAIWRG